MRPGLVQVLKQLPKLGNGKVDHVALKEAASNILGESLVEVTDSLGMARHMSRKAWSSMQTLAAARTASILAIINYHWLWPMYLVHWNCNDVVPALAETMPNIWLRTFFRGNMQSYWSTNIFVLASGWTDQAELQSHQQATRLLQCFCVLCLPWSVCLGGPRLLSTNNRRVRARPFVLVEVIQEVFALVLLLISYCPVPELFGMLQHALGNNLNGMDTGKHRWYPETRPKIIPRWPRYTKTSPTIIPRHPKPLPTIIPRYFLFYLVCRALHRWVFTPLRTFLRSRP